MFYMDDNDKGIRQGAVLACCKILEQHSSLAKSHVAAGGKAYPFGEEGLRPGARGPPARLPACAPILHQRAL